MTWDVSSTVPHGVSPAIVSSYRVRRANLSDTRDRETLFALSTTYQPDAFNRKFEWMYLGNPAGSARVWLLYTEPEDVVVGATAVFPRRFSIDQQWVTAGITGDFFVKRQHRSLGPALQLHRSVLADFQAEHWAAFLYGFPEEMALPIFGRLGYVELGPRSRWVRILRSRSVLMRLPGGTLWGGPVGLALDAASVLLTKGRIRRLSIECVETNAIDDRFDVLWQTLRRGVRVIGDRSAAYLRWRYQSCPGPSCRILTAARRGTRELCGCLIWRQDGDSVEIRDLLCESPITLRALVLTLADLARSQGASVISLWRLKSAAGSGALHRAGLYERPDAMRVVMYKSPSGLPSPFDEALSDAHQWFLVQSDDDM